MDETFASAHSFVRALKAPTDPPRKDGPNKLFISQTAWKTRSIRIPRKASIILEWLLPSLTRTRVKTDLEAVYILNSQYWELLADVLTDPGDTPIAPIISRFSITPSLRAILLSYNSLSESSPALFVQVWRSLVILWPRSTHSSDVLSDLFWVSISLIKENSHRALRSSIMNIITLIWNSFRQSFELVSTNQKKKIITTFSQHIDDWLCAIYADTQSIFTEELYQIGRQVLYSLDNLKSVLDSRQNASCLMSLVFLNDKLRLNQKFRRHSLKLLPRLYKDYLAGLRRHQVALFPSSLNTAQARQRLADIGTNTAVQIIQHIEYLEEMEDESQIWNAISEILMILEQNEIATAKNETEWMSYLCGLRQRTISVMESPWDETRAPLSMHALDIFAFLHRVEPALLDPVLPQILDRIALRKSSSQLFEPAFNLWKQLLSFHSKTRTLHVLTAMLQNVPDKSFSLVSNTDTQAVYGIVAKCPLLSSTFLEELGNTLLTHISPGQNTGIIENICDALKECIQGHSWNTTSVKHRKLSKHATVPAIEIGRSDMASIAFFFAVRANSYILQTLTRTSMSGHTQELSNCLNTLDDSISMSLNQLFSLLKNMFENGASSKKRKYTDISLNWSDRCFFSCLLELSYSLFVPGGHNDSLKTRTTILNNVGIMNSFMEENIFPELQIEIGRWCIFAGVGETERKDECLNAVLDYVEKHGQLRSINGDVQFFSHTAAALLAILLDSYLPILGAVASQEHLHRLGRLLVHQMGRGLQTTNQLSIGTVVDQLLRTASFWEMQKMKTLQVVLEEETSILLSKHTLIRPDMDLDALKRSMQYSTEDLEYTSNIYECLIRFPPNYLSKKLRDDLIVKALNADVFLRFEQSGKLLATRKTEIRADFGAFLTRCWNEQPSKSLGDIASDPLWIEYVFGEYSYDNCLSEDLEERQIALLKPILQNAVKGEVSPLEVILHQLLNHELKAGRDLGNNFVPSLSIRVVNLIVNDTVKSRLPESTILLLDEIRNRLKRVFEHGIESLLRHNVLLSHIHAVIKGWEAYLSLFVWSLYGNEQMVDSKTISHEPFRKVISLCTENTGLEDLYPYIISIGILQIKVSNRMEESKFAEVVAWYLLLSQKNTSPACEEPLSRFCKGLNLDQYEALLDILGEYLEKGGTKILLNSVLHASILFLERAPEKSSRICSTYVSRCLRFLSNADNSQLLSSHICKIFEFLGFQCSERAVSLKPLDIKEILSITNSLTCGSHDHDDHTSYPIFHAIVSMLDSLIRLRHDLLNSFLPHISKILRQLLLLLRTTRSHLGTRQYRLIADSYPRWVNPSVSLRASEGTVLARLLTTFMTKTSVRSRNSNETPKAASLARSFARHAPYVLLAYLEAVTDPLTYIPVPVRKELHPGLFALCTMTGEHGRDTLMIQNLNAEQKLFLKALWGDYIKQKYIGRG